MVAARLPGRLGDRMMSAGTDPRTHPAMLQEMTKYNLQLSSAGELTPGMSLEDAMVFAGLGHEGAKALYNMMDYNVPALTSKVATTRSEEFVTTPEGNTVKLIVYRPSASAGELPAVVYIHGGGMVILDTENHVHLSWVESLARAGLVAIAVDFRNAWTKDGNNPFPAGLNDCAAAVQWIHAHRKQLGISKIVVQGESGGANLSIATTLKAKREGWLDAIDGTVAAIPYISGAYGMPEEWKLANLPSLVECDGYFINCAGSANLVKVYDPTGENTKNPLAWPYWAEEEDLKGLPPFMVCVNELDPLRDEGIAFYKKLARAGVRVIAKMNLGMVHGGELLLRQSVPDTFLAGVAEIKSFADRVSPETKRTWAL